MVADAFAALRAAQKPKSDDGMPWVEKYRPKTLDDLVGNDDAVDACEPWCGAASCQT